jgi:hypothetical protein
MTKQDRHKIREIINSAKNADPTAMTPLVNSILASKIKTILDQKKVELMSKY